MLLTSKIEKAVAIALKIHAKQKRKGDNVTPYAVHPVLVGMLLARYTDDEDVIIAGLLHDAIEDTKYGSKQIKDNFGEKVLNIVEEVTEKSDEKYQKKKSLAHFLKSGKKSSWAERKMNYLVNIAKKSKEACLVTCADKIHNLNGLTELYKKEGEASFKKFNAPKERKIWFYESIYKEMKKKFRHGLIRELHHALKEFKEAETKEKTPKEKKQPKRYIGPYDLVLWEHFNLGGSEELYRLRTSDDLNEIIREANLLTRQAREETLKELPEGSNLNSQDLWNFSKSYGAYDSTGQLVYWSDWLNA